MLNSNLKLKQMEIYNHETKAKTILELNEDELILIEYLLEKNAQKVSDKIENPLSVQLLKRIRDHV